MEKLEGMIITVLGLLDRPAYRTEIVKLIYMIDEMYFRHFGTTISGLDYKWDNFGPNSVDDGIVKTADELVNQGAIHMSTEPNQYGTTSYIYSIEKNDGNEYVNKLTDGDRYVIRNIACQFKGYSLQALIKASKQTASFKGVKQHEPIILKKSEEYQAILKSLKSDDEDCEVIMEATARSTR